MKPSAALVLEMVSRPQGACGGEFLKRGVGRFGGRLHELKQMGYVFEKKPCKRHEHPHGPIYLYSLIAKPEPDGQLALVTTGSGISGYDMPPIPTPRQVAFVEASGAFL